ncbi:MAG TPA: class I SAM-dependent methyltransferase [Solirubrobacteraceae bacterium]|nr:class I SAM-dependent methyltransferase [Solirubrobacteraceae bacterium]
MSSCWICEGDLEPCTQFAPAPFLACTRCGFAFRPDLDEAALARVYAGGDYEGIRGDHYLRELPARRRDARVRLRYMRPWVSRGRLLDVGAAGGAFVAEAAAWGFDASGIEPVESFARAAREHLGVAVRCSRIEDLALASGRYQAVTLWHVLEHLVEPVAKLRRLAEALAPGGAIALEVPNAGGLSAARMGPQWPSLEPDVHVCQFTPASLRRALERAGLEVCDLRTTAITPYLPLRARLDPRHLAGRAKAAYWLRDGRSEHPWGHELLRAIARRSATPRQRVDQLLGDRA